MEKKSWVCTVIIQLAICFTLYYAINMGQPQTPDYRTGIHRKPNEIYFVSVRGGYRPIKEQIHLLKQIEKVINSYKVRFVINISELGEDDPLLRNATQYFSSSKAPWYISRTEEPDYIFKQINVLSATTLDIIALNTRKIRDSSEDIEIQLKQLSRKLESSKSNWHIAAGFRPLVCNQSLELTKAKGNEALHQMLIKHRVDAYLSGHSCNNEDRIGGPYVTTVGQGSCPPKEMIHMFLLHRVSPLEIATYGVSFKGNIVHECTVRQRGREVM